MRIAIANAKGGVAKTTSSIYIASVIVSRGGRAVVYDADPQSSASLWAAAAEQTADPPDVRRAARQPGHAPPARRGSRPGRMGDH